MAKSQFDEIELGIEESNISRSAINEKSVNLPLAKYLLAHIRPHIVQRLQPPPHDTLLNIALSKEPKKLLQ